MPVSLNYAVDPTLAGTAALEAGRGQYRQYLDRIALQREAMARQAQAEQQRQQSRLQLQQMQNQSYQRVRAMQEASDLAQAQMRHQYGLQQAQQAQEMDWQQQGYKTSVGGINQYVQQQQQQGQQLTPQGAKFVQDWQNELHKLYRQRPTKFNPNDDSFERSLANRNSQLWQEFEQRKSDFFSAPPDPFVEFGRRVRPVNQLLKEDGTPIIPNADPNLVAVASGQRMLLENVAKDQKKEPPPLTEEQILNYQKMGFAVVPEGYALKEIPGAKDKDKEVVQVDPAHDAKMRSQGFVNISPPGVAPKYESAYTSAELNKLVDQMTDQHTTDKYDAKNEKKIGIKWESGWDVARVHREAINAIRASRGLAPVGETEEDLSAPALSRGQRLLEDMKKIQANLAAAGTPKRAEQMAALTDLMNEIAAVEQAEVAQQSGP